MKRFTAALMFVAVVGAFAAPAMAGGGNPGLNFPFTLAPNPKIDAIIVMDPNGGSPSAGDASIWLRDGSGSQVRTDFAVPFVQGCDPVNALSQAQNRFLNQQLENIVPNHTTLVKLFSTLGISIASDSPFVIPMITQIVSAKCVPLPGAFVIPGGSYSVVEVTIQLAVPPKK